MQSAVYALPQVRPHEGPGPPSHPPPAPQQDSRSAVSALNKGRSTYDELTTAIVGAGRMAATYLHCDIPDPQEFKQAINHS